MRVPPFALWSSLLVAFLLGAPAFAQAQEAPAAEIAVVSVKPEFVKTGAGEWLEFQVELESRPGGKTTSGTFVSDVEVRLATMIPREGPGGKPRNVFYQAKTRLIAVEAGRAGVRFYLPPEVVERDRVREVKYFLVDLSVAGKDAPRAPAAVAAEFPSEQSIKTFLERLSAESESNDGILVPQHLTPFAHDTRRPTPTPVRRSTAP